MRRNIVVPALLDAQRQELETLSGAAGCRFINLLDEKRLLEPDHQDFDELLDQARQELFDLGEEVHGILAQWDFPTSALVPLLNRELGLPAPSLESVFKCEHKYWSRLEQEKSIPEMVPAFNRVDPFTDNPFDQVTLAFPFWLKPIKAFASQLGFKIESREQFDQAIDTIRAEIGQFGDTFNQALKHVRTPEQIHDHDGNSCIAEEIVTGRQVSPEGSVYNGEVRVHGILDMPPDKSGKMYGSIEYPSQLPKQVHDRMIDACRRYFEHIGFDNGCFNVEFLWDEESDALKVIEFNTRISQSHSEMFILVDGISNHEVALDIALGKTPRMPSGEGLYKVAGKFDIPHYENARVLELPTEKVMQTLEQRFPGTQIRIEVEAGTELKDLPNQHNFFYNLGEIFLGAESRDELHERYQTCLDTLDFKLSPV